MPKNILIDLNVILDVLLERAGHQASQAVLELGEQGLNRLYISAHAVTTFAYLLENAGVTKTQIKRQLNWLLQTFKVVAINDSLLKSALLSRLADYEDAVVERAAVDCAAAAIITRNTKDFKTSLVPALTPENYLRQIKN